MDSSNASLMRLKPPDQSRDHEKIYSLEKQDGTSALEKEEYRRGLWLLLIMDRNHAWPTGWPNALPESHFKVDIPIADKLFQAMTPETSDDLHKNAAFNRNFDHLLTSAPSATSPSINVFHYICIAYVLLGRVCEVVHCLHDEAGTAEYAATCEQLDSQIVKLRLSLPRQASSVLEAAIEDRAHVVWLQIILNNCAMLLNYRCTKDVHQVNAADHFLHAITAARNIAQIVKDASRISINLLLSPHLASALYLAACIHIIQWRTTDDPNAKHGVDLFKLVFDRMDETFIFLGLKFKIALEHDFERSGQSLEELRERGVRGLLADCTKWVHVREEVQRRGIPIDIT